MNELINKIIKGLADERCNTGFFLLCQRFGNALPPGSCRVNSISAEGIPDPSQPRKLGCLPWEDYTSQRSQGKAKPFGFDSQRHKSFRLPSLPGCWKPGAGLWWPEQPTRPQEPGNPVRLLAADPAWKTLKAAGSNRHARPSQPPEGPELPAEAGGRRPDVVSYGSLLRCAADFSCPLPAAWTGI